MDDAAPELDDELSDLFDEEEEEDESEQEANGHTLSIRRADGEEVVSIYATGEEWSVQLQPGGLIQGAYIGSRTDTPVWLTAGDRQIERDDDGTYVINID